MTTELSIYLQGPVSLTTVGRELPKSNINEKAAINKLMITENSAKRRKRWCDDHQTWTSDDSKYVI
jgi:hypothetical protein